MVNTNKLLGIMAEQHKSQEDVAKALNMSRKTFYNRMKNRVFGSDEIEGMIKYLEISDPMPIFFADKVT